MADPEPFATAAEDPDAENDRDDREDTDATEKPKAKEKKKGSFWRELPVLILTALVLTFLIQTFLARVYVIPSQSMEQTLHGCDGCTNDRVLVDKISYRFGEPSPGDVLVFRGPESWQPDLLDEDEPNVIVRGVRQFTSLFGLAPPDERDLVKRVIATEGQTVQCCDDQSRVTVDGNPLDEPYINDEFGDTPQAPFGPIVVPDDHLWMMGDNRNNSADSRAHDEDERQGTIPVDNVIGKARVIVLPPSRWGGISDHNPQGAASAAPAAPGWQAGLPIALSGLLVGGVRLGVSAGGAIRRRKGR